MLKQKTSSKRGFTIIEVVLVLAIAGLIFLMVFLALPALQRSQRDTTRRNELGEFRTQVIQYQSNNRGRVPSSFGEWESIIDSYMNLSKTTEGGTLNTKGEELTEDEKESLSFLDPTGEPYVLAYYCDLGDPANSEASNPNISGVKNLCTTAMVDDRVSTGGLNWNDDKYQIYTFKHARCDGESVVSEEENGNRLIAFVTKLEGNGVYCGEN